MRAMVTKKPHGHSSCSRRLLGVARENHMQTSVDLSFHMVRAIACYEHAMFLRSASNFSVILVAFPGYFGTGLRWIMPKA